MARDGERGSRRGRSGGDGRRRREEGREGAMGPTRPACSGRIGAWLPPRRQWNVQQLPATGATAGEGTEGEGVSHLAPSRAGSRGRGGPCARRTCACLAGYSRSAESARAPRFRGAGGGGPQPLDPRPAPPPRAAQRQRRPPRNLRPRQASPKMAQASPCPLGQRGQGLWAEKSAWAIPGPRAARA